MHKPDTSKTSTQDVRKSMVPEKDVDVCDVTKYEEPIFLKSAVDKDWQ